MNIMPQTLNKLRAKLDRGLVAAPFSSLPEYKSISYHQNLGKLLGIENPFFRSTEGPQGRHTLIDGKPVLNFAWCDYLGLSKHPDLIAASKAAIDAYGTSVSASRMVSGDTPLHRQLEQEIAETIGVEASLVFVRGHAANVSTIGTIMGAEDLIVHDEFVHNSAVVGMRLSGAKTLTYKHNNLEALENILREQRAKYKNALVVIEGLYSTEGDIPDLARVIGPNCEMEIIGKRPGEKTHELMVGEDDAQNTLEYDDYYAILPAVRSWDKDHYVQKNGGRQCAEGFRYSSETNTRWLTLDELAQMIGPEKLAAE